jgi:hypothetical protein
MKARDQGKVRTVMRRRVRMVEDVVVVVVVGAGMMGGEGWL